jgi:hypothetical protein
MWITKSTPAQYMLDWRQDVARYLVRRGCKTDILLAAALGGLELVRKHLDADSDSIRMRVSEEFFAMAHKRAGGTIYNWTLGSGLSHTWWRGNSAATTSWRCSWTVVRRRSNCWPRVGWAMSRRTAPPLLLRAAGKMPAAPA